MLGEKKAFPVLTPDPVFPYAFLPGHWFWALAAVMLGGPVVY